MTLDSLAFDFYSKGKRDRRSIADRKDSIPSITLMQIYIISRVLGDLPEKNLIRDEMRVVGGFTKPFY